MTDKGNLLSKIFLLGTHIELAKNIRLNDNRLPWEETKMVQRTRYVDVRQCAFGERCVWMAKRIGRLANTVRRAMDTNTCFHRRFQFHSSYRACYSNAAVVARFVFLLLLLAVFPSFHPFMEQFTLVSIVCILFCSFLQTPHHTIPTSVAANVTLYCARKYILCTM